MTSQPVPQPPLIYEDFALSIAAEGSFADDGAVRCRVLNLSRRWGVLGNDDAEAVSSFDPFRFWDDPPNGSGGIVGDLALRPQSVTRERVGELGDDLAQIAFPEGPVREFFRAALTWLENEPSGAVRLRLIIEEQQLTDLPWEFMTFPHEGFRFLAQHRRLSIVRTNVSRAQKYRRRQNRNAIEYVGVLAPTTGDRALNVEPDDRAVTEALAEVAKDKTVHATRFGNADEPARWTDVVRALERGTDIFHFVGHGDYGDGADGDEGVLVFEGEGRAEDPVPSANIGPVLQNADVRLALLGACHSARTGSVNPWNGIATHLTSLGVPAVVGNQFPILDHSAQLLATNVLNGVLNRQAIDQSVAATRASLVAEKRFGIDFGIPVVYLDNGDGVLFPDTADDSISPAIDGSGGRSNVEVERRALAFTPYRGVESFARRHGHVFFGRDGLIEEVLAGLRSSDRVVAVFGPSGAGKSSLVEAGVAPQWDGPSLRVGEYLHLGHSLEQSLAELTGLEGASLGEKLRAAEAGGPLLIVLDQFEDFFVLEKTAADPARQAIERLVRERPQNVALLFAFSQDAFAKFDDLQHGLGVDASRVLVTRLTRGQARAALERPLTTLTPQARFADEDLLTDILDQLDGLNPREDDSIEPTELQIVAQSLFLSARNRQLSPTDPVVIERRDFVGASVIITKYLEDQIQRFFVDDAEDARAVLQEVALQRDPGWVKLPDTRTVRRLVDSGFLVHRARGDEEYAFSRDAVSEFVGRWVDPEIQEIRRARELLVGLNAGWEMTDEKTIPPATLHGLARIADRLECSAGEASLLLRSAVASNEDAAVWLDVVRTRAGSAIQMLEAGEPVLDLDKRLLGIARDEPPEVGALSKAAASGTQPTDRMTAALALSTTDDFTTRLELAIDEHTAGRERRSRRRELWATITDAEPKLRLPDAALPERIAISLTRSGRRIRRGLGDASGHALAAAVGAGTALGLYRAVMCGIECSPGIPGWAPGVQFGTNLAWVGLVVLLTVLTTRLTSSVGGGSHPWRSWVVGTVVFGATLSAVGAIGGFSLDQYPWTIPVAFLSAVPMATGLSLKRTKPTLAAAALAVMLVWAGGQLLLATKGGETCDFDGCERSASLPVVESAWFYADDKDNVTGTDIGWSVFDAALAGGLIFIGASAGAHVRHRLKGDARIPA